MSAKTRCVAGVAMLCVAIGFVANADGASYRFRFSEEDLWNHSPSANTALYEQDAPRRHHTNYKTNVQTTDSAQDNASQYHRAIGQGTSGFAQTDTYDTWLDDGPLDNLGNPFGIAHVQLWGANFSNSKFAWGERFKLADTGSNAWSIIKTPNTWGAEVAQNPWPDASFSNNMYYISWSADSYGERITYDKYGDGVEDYVFEFEVDIAGEYPSSPTEDPLDGDPFEDDGTLRVWFGGYQLDHNNQWTTEGYDGVMELSPVPEPLTMLAFGSAVAGLGGYIRRRRRA